MEWLTTPDPSIRAAALRSGEADPGVINDHVGFFAPGSVYASDAGMENVSPDPDFAALRTEVLAAGHNGEEVVFLGASDVAHLGGL